MSRTKNDFGALAQRQGLNPENVTTNLSIAPFPIGGGGGNVTRVNIEGTLIG